jgi:hypothetical protein
MSRGREERRERFVISVKRIARCDLDKAKLSLATMILAADVDVVDDIADWPALSRRAYKKKQRARSLACIKEQLAAAREHADARKR